MIHMWFVAGTGIFAVLVMFVVIPLVDWWYELDRRRPARDEDDDHGGPHA